MDIYIIENIMQTAFVVAIACITIIRFHGDEEVSFLVKSIEVILLIVSTVMFFVFAIIFVWTK